MLHNKFFWIVVAVLVVGGVTLLIQKIGHNKNQLVEDAISLLKQGDDRSHDCEAFDKLVGFASNSKVATLMIGEMYARGMCHPFDLEKSLEWFKKANLSNAEIGSALFHAASWEIPANENVGPSKDQLIVLLAKSKEFGYMPSKVELDRFPTEYAAVFQ